MSPNSEASPFGVPRPRLALKVPPDEARSKLRQQIEKALRIRDPEVRSADQLDRRRAEQSKWAAYTAELLRRLFTNDSIVDEFNSLSEVGLAGAPLSRQIADFHDRVQDRIDRLESIVERVELFEEPPGAAPAAAVSGEAPRPVGQRRKIFVVHGHDEGARETVCRVLEKLQLQPVVLHEHANRGRTIIEKFEYHSDVEFAVVIMTGDDVGASKGAKRELQPRARQNVILESGYFLGKLGRERVCALYQSGVELPSDYSGILFVPLDAGGTWKLQMAKELRAAGIEVDLNRL